MPIPFPPPGSVERERIFALVAVTLWFLAVYTLAGNYAKGLAYVPTAVLPWDRTIPFVDWMVIPYFFSGYLFARAFFWCRTGAEVTTLRNRMLLVIAVAGLVFLVCPLRHAFTKPAEVALPFQPLFWLLRQSDSPFNQAPSLHVTFCVLHAGVARWRFSGAARWAVWLGLGLIAASTLFVYQHHIVDVVSGLMLGALALLLLPKKYGAPALTQP